MSKSLEIFGLLLCQNLLPTPFKNCPIWSHCGTNLHRMFDTSTSQTEPYILLMYLRCTYFPVVHLLDGDSNPVVELHYDVGTTIEMVCRVRRPPLSHATVLWEIRRISPLGQFFPIIWQFLDGFYLVFGKFGKQYGTFSLL